MHRFLIVYIFNGEHRYEIVNAWDKKEAVERFYEKTLPHTGSMSVDMFRKVIKALSVGEAVAVYNSLSASEQIVEMYENLYKVDLSNEFEETNSDEQ